jgi:hypothetical protein
MTAYCQARGLEIDAYSSNFHLHSLGRFAGSLTAASG